MSDVVVSRAAHCPTCRDGRCPEINTTPDSPEPGVGSIRKAMEDIPGALEDFKCGARYEAIASVLVERLLQPEFGGHQKSSAEWAIHYLIRDERLTAHETRLLGRPAPMQRSFRRWVTNEGFKRPSPMYDAPPYHLYSDGPNPFDTFLVRAEELLWKWRRDNDTMPLPALGASNGRTPIKNGEDRPSTGVESKKLFPRDIRNKIVCSSKTFNKYGGEAQVPTTRKSHRERPLTTNQYLAVLKAMEASPSKELREKAKKVLAEMDRS
jgi:hypothetical protein